MYRHLGHIYAWLRSCILKALFSTWTLDEGPVVAPVRRTQTLIQNHVLVTDSLSNPGSSSLHWASVGTLHANTLACVGGISAPSTLGPLQTLGTRPQTWAVLSCGGNLRGMVSILFSHYIHIVICTAASIEEGSGFYFRLILVSVVLVN